MKSLETYLKIISNVITVKRFTKQLTKIFSDIFFKFPFSFLNFLYTGILYQYKNNIIVIYIIERWTVSRSADGKDFIYLCSSIKRTRCAFFWNRSFKFPLAAPYSVVVQRKCFGGIFIIVAKLNFEYLVMAIYIGEIHLHVVFFMYICWKRKNRTLI